MSTVPATTPPAPTTMLSIGWNTRSGNQKTNAPNSPVLMDLVSHSSLSGQLLLALHRFECTVGYSKPDNRSHDHDTPLRVGSRETPSWRPIRCVPDIPS